MATIGLHLTGAPLTTTTSTTCAIYEAAVVAVSAADPSLCSITHTGASRSYADSLLGASASVDGYLTVGGYMDTATYGEVGPSRPAEARAEFGFSGILITSGPQRPGTLQFTLQQYSHGTYVSMTTEINGLPICLSGQCVGESIAVTLGAPITVSVAGSSFYSGEGHNNTEAAYSMYLRLYDNGQPVTELQAVNAPEPGSMALVAIGALAVALVRRKAARG